MSVPATTVVIVPREKFSATRRSLESILACTPAPRRIVYVDGGSPPRVARYLQEQAREHDLLLLRSDTYLVPNRARNAALSHVDTEFVAFLDNDVVVSDGWLAHLEACARETRAWLVAPLYLIGDLRSARVHCARGECRIVDHDGRRWFHVRNPGSNGPLEAVLPACREEAEMVEYHLFLARTSVFETVGPFDEIVASAREHTDLSLAVRAHGGTIWYEPAARATYLQPKWLRPSDLPYYVLRWSDAWIRRSYDRFAEKWSLSDDDPFRPEDLRMLAGWRLRGYRPYRSPFGRMLHRRGRIANPLVDRVAQRLVTRAHERRAASSPDLRVVHRPHWAAADVRALS